MALPTIKSLSLPYMQNTEGLKREEPVPMTNMMKVYSQIDQAVPLKQNLKNLVLITNLSLLMIKDLCRLYISTVFCKVLEVAEL